MNKKYKNILFISLISIFKMTMLFDKEIEIIYYSLLTGEHIDYYESSKYSLIAVNEEKDTTRYHIFLKIRNRVVKNNHLTYEVTKDQISQIKQKISDIHTSYTIICEMPRLRKPVTNLTIKTLEENLSYSIVIENPYVLGLLS